MKNLSTFEKLLLVILLIATIVFIYFKFFKKSEQAARSETENKNQQPGVQNSKSASNSETNAAKEMEKQWQSTMDAIMNEARFKDNSIVNILYQFNDPVLKNEIIKKAIDENKPLDQEIVECAMHMMRATEPKSNKSGMPASKMPRKYGTTIAWAENPDT